MDKHLGTILSCKGPDGLHSAKMIRFLANFCVIVNAKRVKYCCDEHVFSNEADVTVSLNLGHSMIE